MTNNFIFESSPNSKPKQKKVGVMAYYIPSPEKRGGTRPPRPPPNFGHGSDPSFTGSTWHQ